MSVDTATVQRIATLARIRVADSDLAPLAGEMSKILDWVEKLGAVDTDGVPPMTSVVEHALYWRTDEITDGNCTEDILKNAPVAEFGCFGVPKVID